jgi:hypothetical protein
MHFINRGKPKMTVITLPRSAIKEMNDKYVKIEIPEKELIVKKISGNVLEAARGILKDYKIDPMEYQKKCRDEWDRI